MTDMPSWDATDLARRLAENAEAVCRHYLSAGRRHGNYWLVGDVHNTPGRSLYVRLHGGPDGRGRAGKWTDGATGQHGDLLDIIRESLGLLDFRDVADEARRFLCLPQPVPRPASDRGRSDAFGHGASPQASGTADAARRLETYGSARWAELEEIAKAGLLDPDGVVLGRYRKTYLRHDGPEHVLTFAPTRSGKGVGMVIPTLLTWPGSAIVHDIKGENWELTAGFRARFGRVVLFDPTNAASSAYNPLLEIRRGEWEVRDAQNVADILVDPEGSLEKRNHWEKTSHSLLVGAILHVLYADPDKTLAGVANFLSDPKRPIATTLSVMMRTNHLGEKGPHPVVASAARELLNKSPNERSGVLSTAMSFL
ncbi:type IV secretory system conjugative DNA transfer family protein, partial [Acetobacter fabarum]